MRLGALCRHVEVFVSFSDFGSALCCTRQLTLLLSSQVLLGYDNRFAQACERRGYGDATLAYNAAVKYDLAVLDKLAVRDETLLAWIEQRSSGDFGMRAWHDAGPPLGHTSSPGAPQATRFSRFGGRGLHVTRAVPMRTTIAHSSRTATIAMLSACLQLPSCTRLQQQTAPAIRPCKSPAPPRPSSSTESSRA